MRPRAARRRFVACAVAVLATPGRALAQSPDRPKRVLFFTELAPERAAIHLKAFGEGLHARGWIEGRNLRLEVRYAQGPREDLPKIAEGIVRAAPDVILVGGPRLAAALKKTGTSIATVFAVVFDPIGLGLGKSFARPGGAFTGISTSVPGTFSGKMIELLREAVPGMKRIALLSNPNNPMQSLGHEALLKTVHDQGLEAIGVEATTREELQPAFREAAQRGAGGMFVLGDVLTVRDPAFIADLALRHRLPTIFQFDQNVDAGGLMSYGADIADVYRRCAYFADRILRGAKPADLPIEQPTKFNLVVNLKTAKALGLKLPQTLLQRADRVIE